MFGYILELIEENHDDNRQHKFITINNMIKFFEEFNINVKLQNHIGTVLYHNDVSNSVYKKLNILIYNNHCYLLEKELKDMMNNNAITIDANKYIAHDDIKEIYEIVCE